MTRVTKERLIEQLREIAIDAQRDAEKAHGEADEALLHYIADPRVREAFESVKRYYA
jgi:hypothetical protein